MATDHGFLYGQNLEVRIDPEKEYQQIDGFGAFYAWQTITLDGYGSVMYNLRTNLGETDDLSKTELAKFDSISNVYNNWQSQSMPTLWDEGETWMDIFSHIHRRLMQNKEAEYKRSVVGSL